MSKVYSFLAGQPVNLVERPPAAPVRLQPKGPPPKARADVMLETMGGILEYLKLEPAERAKREAEPLLAAERSARQVELAAAARTHEQALAARAAEVSQVRGLLDETARQNEGMQAEIGRLTTAMEQAAREAQEAATRHAAELAAAGQQAPAPAPAPIVAPAPPLNPQDIKFELRHHANGLLRSLVMSAPGHKDLLVEIPRGADNRIRDINLKDT